MFHSARIKLTGWYVLLILSLTTLVSLFVYMGINQELVHLEQVQDLLRYQNPEIGQNFGFIQHLSTPLQAPEVGGNIKARVVRTDVSEVRWRVISTIIFVNTGVAFFIGIVSYILAGKTLKPIQRMVEQQKRFLTDAAHELRTPLTALRTATEVQLRNKKLTLAETKNLLKENLDEIKNLQYLSEGLLRLSALENHDLIFDNQQILASELFQTAMKKVLPAARLKKISLKTEKSTISVIGDKLALIEVLVILLDNAIKYSPKNTTIFLGVHHHKYVTAIEVSDQGFGIDPLDLPHIFDRFYRGDQSRSNKFGSGYGLGLSIAKRIIDDHHGQIKVDSKPGKGTRFLITLPNQPEGWR